ncbi:hypothetical protein C0J50_5684 [Silurus asotus]|uniref:Uncharacterized protein n=1 Tax=Silurus asotus TaxID=30991 RepID=A0AAD5FBQ4_SILAS|nr:hypothetical protein C0J50_5684 [Silurus asotus]
MKEKEKRKPPCNCQIDCYCKIRETASERKQERENEGTAPPWEKCEEQQKPPPYNEKPPGYVSGLYPQLPYSNETPERVTLELTGGTVEGFIRSAYSAGSRAEPDEGKKKGVTKNERLTTNVRKRQNKAKGKSRFKKEQQDAELTWEQAAQEKALLEKGWRSVTPRELVEECERRSGRRRHSGSVDLGNPLYYGSKGSLMNEEPRNNKSKEKIKEDWEEERMEYDDL